MFLKQGSLSIVLYHTNANFLDDFVGAEPVFTKRGSIIIRSVKANKAVFSQLAPLSHEERKTLRVC